MDELRYIQLPGHTSGPRTKYSRQNAWVPTHAAEIYLFLGILIYMSVHTEPDFMLYWATDPTTPTHPITRFMSRNRFQLLYRKFCTWDTTETSAVPTVFERSMLGAPIYKTFRPNTGSLRQMSVLMRLWSDTLGEVPRL